MKKQNKITRTNKTYITGFIDLKEGLKNELHKLLESHNKPKQIKQVVLLVKITNEMEGLSIQQHKTLLNVINSYIKVFERNDLLQVCTACEQVYEVSINSESYCSRICNNCINDNTVYYQYKDKLNKLKTDNYSFNQYSNLYTSNRRTIKLLLLNRVLSPYQAETLIKMLRIILQFATCENSDMLYSFYANKKQN